MHWKDFVYFFIGVVIPSYNLFDWVNIHFGKLLNRLFIRTERQAVIYLHAKLHAKGDGHAPKSPVECNDGDCIKV